MSEKNSFQKALCLHRTAAEIVALALYELYPDLKLVGAEYDEISFSYEVVFSHTIQKEILEEKMREIISQKREIRTLEMVPFSASEMLKAEGHLLREKKIPNQTLVELIEIGSFHDLSSGPHLKNTEELKAFSLEIEPLKEKRVKIRGWCAFSKEELKDFLKRKKHYIEPKVLAEERGYQKGRVFLFLGLKVKKNLIKFLKEALFDGVLEIQGPFDEDYRKTHASMGAEKVGEVRFERHDRTLVLLSFFFNEKEEKTSPLHLIGKTLTMLGFDHCSFSDGRADHFVVVDALGRPRRVARVQREKKNRYIEIEVEPVIELMLEKNTVGRFEN